MTRPKKEKEMHAECSRQMESLIYHLDRMEEEGVSLPHHPQKQELARRLGGDEASLTLNLTREEWLKVKRTTGRQTTLIISPFDIVAIASVGNHIHIFWLNDGQPERDMIRIPLKEALAYLRHFGLRLIERGFCVNANFILGFDGTHLHFLEGSLQKEKISLYKVQKSAVKRCAESFQAVEKPREKADFVTPTSSPFVTFLKK
jgi:hypothetical protein